MYFHFCFILFFISRQIVITSSLQRLLYLTKFVSLLGLKNTLTMVTELINIEMLTTANYNYDYFCYICKKLIY